MPLQPMFEVRSFAQWALEFFGVINPNSFAGHKFILIATYYCTRWTEAIACRNANAEVVLKFIDEHIVTRFGMPFALVCDNGPTFTSAQLMQWSYEYKVILKFSSNYYPQGNGVVESTNKNILDVIKKLLEKNPGDWHNQLRYALWADLTRVKVILGNSPYYLVYGQNPIFLVNLQLHVLQLMKEREFEDQVEVRLLNLLKLDEKGINTLQHFAKH